MDINTFRALSTVLVAIAFMGICWWAFSPKRREKFRQASELPFADEKKNVGKNTEEASSQKQSNDE